MAATTVYQVGGDPFAIWEDEAVFSVRRNPLDPTSRIFGSFFGLIFLGAGIAIYSFSAAFGEDAPRWVIYGMAAAFCMIGLFVLKLSLAKEKKLRFVELDKRARVVRFGHYVEDARETDGEVPVGRITDIRLEVGANDEIEYRARDGKIQHGHTRLEMKFEGGRLRRNELLAGDYYVMKDLFDRIEISRRTA